MRSETSDTTPSSATTEAASGRATAPGKRTLTQQLTAAPRELARPGGASAEESSQDHDDEAELAGGETDDPFGLHLLAGPIGHSPIGSERANVPDDGHNLREPMFRGEPRLEACYDDRDRLTIGDSGPPVAKVKQALVRLGFQLGSRAQSSLYDFATWLAVIEFKKQHHLKPDQWGDVGPLTMKTLDDLFLPNHPVPPPSFPRDIPVPPLEPRQRSSTKFMIRFVRGLSLSAIIGVDLLQFEIIDVANSLKMGFGYTAAGLFTPGPMPGALTAPGGWKPFTTPQPVSLIQFARLQATFTSAGAGTASISHLMLRGLPFGGLVLEIPTGASTGFGASTTHGAFTSTEANPEPVTDMPTDPDTL
jgi:hypothetical protein